MAARVSLDDCALILGGARTVWYDVLCLEELIGRRWPGIVVATNDAAVYWPRRLDHLATAHPEKVPGWIQEREELHGIAKEYTTWGRRNPELIDALIEPPWGGGSSAWFALWVARLAAEARVVVLCGCPLDESPHFHDRAFAAGRAFRPDGFRGAWERFAQEHGPDDWVRSMSGWTRQLLGAPTRPWLEGRHE